MRLHCFPLLLRTLFLCSCSRPLAFCTQPSMTILPAVGAVAIQLGPRTPVLALGLVRTCQSSSACLCPCCGSLVTIFTSMSTDGTNVHGGCSRTLTLGVELCASLQEAQHALLQPVELVLKANLAPAGACFNDHCTLDCRAYVFWYLLILTSHSSKIWMNSFSVILLHSGPMMPMSMAVCLPPMFSS